MRRLIDWLGMGYFIHNIAHVAAGVLCLIVLAGALWNSARSVAEEAPLPLLMASADYVAPPLAHVVADAPGATLLRFSPAVRPAEFTDAALTPLRLEARSLEEERRCLAAGIYFEARGESFDGQLAVAEVILNRVKSGQYSDSICGVVFQGASKRNQCQFSFACDGKTARPRDMVAWRKATRLARYVMMGQPRALVGPATYYHAASVNPEWAQDMVAVRRIGRHIFYKKLPDRS